MALTTQQQHLIRAASIAKRRPSIGPASTATMLPSAAPLYLIPTNVPPIVPTFARPPLAAAIVALDASRFPIACAQRHFGWAPGQYFSCEILANSAAVFTPSPTATKYQIDSSGRLRLPTWIRQRLFIDPKDTIYFELHDRNGVQSLTIASILLISNLLTTHIERNIS